MVIAGAGAERAEQQIIRTGSGVLAAGGDRLVGEYLMRADIDDLLEFAGARLAHHHLARLFRQARYGRDGDRIEIAPGPGGDDIGDIDRVMLLREQMIGAGQQDEALGMFGSDENLRGVVDAHGVVGGRMHDQQRLVQPGRPW